MYSQKFDSLNYIELTSMSRNKKEIQGDLWILLGKMLFQFFNISLFLKTNPGYTYSCVKTICL